MKNRTYLLTGFCLLVCTQAAFAEKKDREQHGSHEHGAARLTIATTDTGLEIALESPATNLFGFEHKAGTPEQQDVVHDALEKLEAGANLFSMNEAAACAFDKATVESAIAESHDEDEHEDEEKSHSDVDVTWTFTCEQPTRIQSVDTKLFAAFPSGFEDIDVEWITASRAGKTELQKDETISLKQ